MICPGSVDGDENVFLGTHAELLGVVEHMGGVAGSHTLFKMDFAMVGGGFYGIYTGAVARAVL